MLIFLPLKKFGTESKICLFTAVFIITLLFMIIYRGLLYNNYLFFANVHFLILKYQIVKLKIGKVCQESVIDRARIKLMVTEIPDS